MRGAARSTGWRRLYPLGVDSPYQVDREALLQAIDSQDHLIFRFTIVQQRLLVDFRSNETEGPGVHLLPPARSMRERVASISKVRPEFPRPDQLYVIGWPLRVAALERLDVLQPIRDRLIALDAFEQVQRLDRAYEELLQSERDETRRAVTGEGYRTIWPEQSEESE